MSRAAAERERFRDERLNQINSGVTMTIMPLDENPRVVLHMIPHAPLENFDLEPYHLPAIEHETSDIPVEVRPFLPLIDRQNRRVGGRFDDEGLLVYARPTFDIKEGAVVFEKEDKSAYSYVRVFRNGSIEAVRATYFRGDPHHIDVQYERDLSEAADRYLTIQQRLGVQPPISVYVTLTGTSEARLSNRSKEPLSGSLVKDPFHLPEIVVTGFDSTDHDKLAEGLNEGFQLIRSIT